MPKYSLAPDQEAQVRTAIERLQKRVEKQGAVSPPTEDSILGAQHDREGIELLGRCLAGEAPLETSPELDQEARDLEAAQEALKSRGWALNDARRRAYLAGVLLRGTKLD